MALDFSDFTKISEWLRTNEPDGCPKCGNDRFEFQIVTLQEMEWMGRGLIEIGQAIKVTCTKCGTERFFLPK